MRALALLTLLACTGCVADAAPQDKASPSTGHVEHHGGDVELAVLMLRNQIHVNKLWFAGQAKNWELAGFYVHELEETTEAIVEANMVDDGQAISAMTRAMLPTALKAVEGAIKKKDTSAFELTYDHLVTTCNACHKATRHGFIKLKRPSRPIMDNQTFAP